MKRTSGGEWPSFPLTSTSTPPVKGTSAASMVHTILHGWQAGGHMLWVCKAWAPTHTWTVSSLSMPLSPQAPQDRAESSPGSPGHGLPTHRVDTEYRSGSKAQFWPATVTLFTSSALTPRFDPRMVTRMPPPNGPVSGWI